MSIDPKQFVNDLAQDIQSTIERHLREYNDRQKTEYVGDLYRTDYTVFGRGAFPIDMLRYANSWPADEADASIIERSHESDVEGSDTFTLRLTKYHRDPIPNLAEDRWTSKFRWTVMRATINTTRLG